MKNFWYILSVAALLAAPACTKQPAGEQGAHKLTNASASEPLVYIDFDTLADPNVCVYPESNKVGIYGSELRKIYRLEDNVDYYDRE